MQKVVLLELGQVNKMKKNIKLPVKLIIKGVIKLYKMVKNK